MDLVLKNKEWKEFLIGDIFNISTGALVPKKLLKKGNLARITASDINNGVFDYYAEIKHKNYRTVSNFISISFLGSVFYHPYSASLDMKIHSIQLKENEFNKYLAHFFVLVLKRTTSLFSYGDQLSSTDLPKKKIMLPINSKQEPDFDFMEAYIKQKEQEKIEQYNNYINHRTKGLKEFKDVVPLEEKEWVEFKLQDIFHTTKGDQNKMTDLKKGSCPLVSAKNANNGLKDFVSINNKKVFSNNTLTLNNDGDGGAGISYFQPFKYLLDSHVTSLNPKRQLSRFSLLFISRCITKQRNKFGHGYALTNNRLTAFKIMLPVNDQKEPDYSYMENYMKQLEFNKLNNYLKKKLN